MILPRPRVLLITNRTQAHRPLTEVVDGALAGGCRWISVREKDLPTGERRRLGRDIVKRAAAFGATVTLHGDIASAEAARAAGVHVPFGTAPGAIKAILGKAAIVGVSVHSWEEAERAQEDGADYLTVSPVFETASKPSYGPALGLEILGEFCAALDIPVIALGGITGRTAGQCIDAGAAGVAVMGEIMRADDPKAAMAEIVAGVEGACS